jgi:hypothetical protein
MIGKSMGLAVPGPLYNPLNHVKSMGKLKIAPIQLDTLKSLSDWQYVNEPYVILPH